MVAADRQVRGGREPVQRRRYLRSTGVPSNWSRQQPNQVLIPNTRHTSLLLDETYSKLRQT